MVSIRVNESKSYGTQDAGEETLLLQDVGGSDENVRPKPPAKGMFEDKWQILALIMAGLSGLFFTLCSVMVKLFPDLPSSEVVLFRGLVQTVLIIPMMFVIGANPLGPEGQRVLICCQGLVSCLAAICNAVGFSRLPAGDVVTIIFSSPALVMIFAHFLDKEHCGMFRVLVIAPIMVGVVLITKPPFIVNLFFPSNGDGQVSKDIDWLGYGFTFLGTLFTASIFIFLRKLRNVHYLVIIFAFSVTTVVVSGIITFADDFKLPYTPMAWLYIPLVGIFGMLGQCLQAIALRYQTAGVVSVLRSLDIIAAYIIQVVWFGEIPMWTNILGALLVILSVVIMTLEELVLKKLRSKFGSIGWC